MAISEDFYYYAYPFHLPIERLQFNGKYDEEIKKEIVHRINIEGLKKEFPLEDFLDRFPVSNSPRTLIKTKIIDTLNVLVQANTIDSYFELIDKPGKRRV